MLFKVRRRDRHANTYVFIGEFDSPSYEFAQEQALSVVLDDPQLPDGPLVEATGTIEWRSEVLYELVADDGDGWISVARWVDELALDFYLAVGRPIWRTVMLHTVSAQGPASMSSNVALPADW